MPTTPRTICRVLVLNENAAICPGLRALIESRTGYEIAGQGRPDFDAAALVQRTGPDVILLELERAERVEHLPDLRSAADGAPILIVTALRDPSLLCRALRSGAMGIVPKDEVVESLGAALEEIHAGRAWVRGTLLAEVLAGLSRGDDDTRIDAKPPPTAPLTRREQQIVQLVIRGLRNRTVADQLFLSEGTVRNHLTIIFRKLGLAHRCQLIAYARVHRIASSPPGTPPHYAYSKP